MSRQAKAVRPVLIVVVLLALCLLTGCVTRWNPFAPDPYLEVNGQEIENPSIKDLENGLQNLDGGVESYVYLELDRPVGGLWYLSAALPETGYEDGLGYIIEACADAGEDDYTYYEYRTTDQKQVLTWFREFFRGKSAPDVSGWEDITDWYFDDYDYYDDYYNNYDNYYDYNGGVPI